jgi:hypothetical protein
MASTSPSHSTHFDSTKGPGLPLNGSGCYVCHADGDEQCVGQVLFGEDGLPLSVTYVCDDCHSEGGAFDGVVMAKDNWAEGIYEADGVTLQSGKEQWCVTCHDQDPPQPVIDDFEAYTDDDSLRAEWIREGDAYYPYLDVSGGPDGSKCMQVWVSWTGTGLDYGAVRSVFSSPMDMSEMDSVNFYVKADNGGEKVDTIRVRLVKSPGGQQCWSDYYTRKNLLPGVWKLISLPRSSFTDIETINLVSEIQFLFHELGPGGNDEENVYFDNISFTKSKSIPIGGGPNIVGDNETYGYFVTGHKFRNCTWCHDAAKPHIDGQSKPVLDYIMNTPNPTNFRFYDDSNMGLTLPYGGDDDYVPGPQGSFALCYGCHDEADILDQSDYLLGVDLNTNFRDQTPNEFCDITRNLHFYHVEHLHDSDWPSSCVHCHDPHGKRNPAMTRKEMADSIFYDENGCEIEQGADSDGDGIDDWHDPDVNRGLAMTDTLGDDWGYGLNCSDQCHSPDLVKQPNESPCNPGDNPYPEPGICMHNYYSRDYKFIPHIGGPCEDCHGQDSGYGGSTGGAGTYQSHSTHTEDDNDDMKGPNVDCADCHDTASYPDFADSATTLAATTVCENCHSPGGAFDGVNDPVIGVKTNWAEGIYEGDGKTLRSGKEQWCATCHDNSPANSQKDGSGTSAPNVVGDNSTYGFYVGGHKINCLSCHDVRRNHIDHEHRTYQSSLDNYRAGYRLGSSMTVPLPSGSSRTFYNAQLCFDCHNPDEVLGNGALNTTNFNDGSHQLHKTHFTAGGPSTSDSDFDGTKDSGVSCITCHNVHGARNSAMIRSGELISTPGTTDKVPAFDFTYLTAGPNDPYAALIDTLGGDMQYGAGFGQNHICADCHGSQIYNRTPNLNPRVLDRKATPAMVPQGVATAVLFTARVLDPDDNIDTVTIDLSAIGGLSGQTMYDDGIGGGDVSAGDDVFSLETTVPGTVASGVY